MPTDNAPRFANPQSDGELLVHAIADELYASVAMQRPLKTLADAERYAELIADRLTFAFEIKAKTRPGHG